MEIIAWKKSLDLSQNHLREQKAIWNKSTTDLIAKIIAFKRGLNGRGDPRVGLPPSNIKEPLPIQVGQYLNHIASDYEALVNGAEKIIQEQEHYSQIRKKTQPKQTQNSNTLAADDGHFLDEQVPLCPECNESMQYNNGYYSCNCGYLEPNSENTIKLASWWGSRWWASNFGGKKEDREIIKNMLRSAVSMRHKILDIENYLSSSDPNSIPKALAITSVFGIGPYKSILQFFDILKDLHGRELKEEPKKEPVKEELVTKEESKEESKDSKTINPIQLINNLVEIQKDLPNLQSVANYYIARDEVSSTQKTILKSLKGAACKGSDISIYVNKLKQGLLLAENEVNDTEKIILAYRKLLGIIAQLIGFDSLNFAEYAKKIQELPLEVKAEHVPIDHNPIGRFLNKKWLKHKPDLFRSDIDLDMRKQLTIEHLDKVSQSLEEFMDVLVAHGSIDEIFKSLKNLSILLAEVIEDVITLAEYHTTMFRDENRTKRKGVILEPIIEREINKLRKANVGIQDMSSKILIHKPDFVLVST